MPHAIMCPQCNAPLAPHRFARNMVCSYCGANVQLDETAVPASVFHDAFRAWNNPASYVSSWISLGESHWFLDRHIARGDISDVYTAQRARWPTELVIVKLLLNARHAALFDNEWEALNTLHKSNAPGADTFTALLPQPVAHGELAAGSRNGGRANIYRWAGGFCHTFEQVKEAYPRGIPPRASVWVWRRILEMLAFIHRSGMVHGALLPSHLIVQDGEHGVRLVGYSAAGRSGEKLRTVSEHFKDFYPQGRAPLTLTPQLDLIMSARCIAALLRGNLSPGALPETVPSSLAAIVQRTARADPNAQVYEDAWALRDELGEIGRKAFGPPQFCPIVMRS